MDKDDVKELKNEEILESKFHKCKFLNSNLC